ncbi:MAG: UvrB/UvrC motif-containing protein [Candidatus Hydrothermae bacterium]|nr:UvrB/UvrC motif-containing protein [Candidatus Hydrothermae bacterium]
MLCENCKIREAKVTLIEVKNGQTKILHLCPICAEKLSLGLPEKSASGSESPGEKAEKKSRIEETRELVCSTCGTTFSEFAKKGRFGCPDCYFTFGDKVKEILEEIHGSTLYRGRRYSTDRKVSELLKREKELEEALERAVREENFEEAARIRDELQKLRENGK